MLNKQPVTLNCSDVVYKTYSKLNFLESKQVPKSMNDEAAESQQTTSPRQGFTKQQSHVRFLLDDEVEQKARRNEEVQEQKKAPEHSQVSQN